MTEKEYNTTSQSGGLLAPKKSLFGFQAVPGDHLQSYLIVTKCSKCNSTSVTDGEAAWNIKSCICRYYYGPCWWIWQNTHGKDFTMKDCTHKCGSCKEVLADYKSC